MTQVPAVGGITEFVEVPVTVSLTAYAAGDVIGGLQVIQLGPLLDANSDDPARTGVVLSAMLSDAAGATADVDLLLFSADPTSGSTLTDNTAIALGQAALEACSGVVQFNTWTTVGDDALASVASVGLPYRSDPDARIYGVLIARGTPTYGAADDLHLRLGVLED